jgi:hypothetical protein
MDASLRTATATPADAAAVVRRETIANTVATAVIAALLTVLIFRGRDLIPAFEAPPGGIFGILPGTFNFTLLVTLVLSQVIRARVRRGGAPRAPRVAGLLRGAWLPSNLLLRALLLAAVATVLLVPLSAGLVRGLVGLGVLPEAWSLAGMGGYFVLHFVVLSLLVTPPVVWRALQD